MKRVNLSAINETHNCMKMANNILSKALCALILCGGLVSFAYAEGQHKDGADKCQTNDGITNTFGGVTLTASHCNLTETGVTFCGKAILAEGYTTESFGILYSTEPKITSSTAEKYPIYLRGSSEFSFSIESLKPATTYYYALYIMQGPLYKLSKVSSFTTTSFIVPDLNDATDITDESATISGTVNLASCSTHECEYGIQYSSDSDLSSYGISKKIIRIDSECKFSLPIASLAPATTYYYRSYIRKNGVYYHGEIKSFKTASLIAPSLDDVTDITDESAIINGTVILASGTAADLEYGIQYSISKRFSSNVSTKRITDIDYDNRFSIPIIIPPPGTTYYYRSYVKKNGSHCYSEVKSFRTPHPYVDQADLDALSAIDLSSSASANCYIVSEVGLYKFKTVKGNSSESVGNVASASILWESFGTSETPYCCDLIKAFCYKDGYIAFQTADTFKEGNAVIAAKDEEGNILWSWHIWMTDQPQGQVYYNNAGTMMDRNLGATSATPGDVGVQGLLYQWGRKDPFLGSSSISSSTLAKSTITWPSAVSSNSTRGTISYATANPTTFITYNDSNYDWYYTGSSSTDNTRWATSESSKSIYDPCPAGWRVPDGGANGVWSKAKGSSSSFSHTNNDTNEGMNFSGKFGSASTIWYPASGCRNSSGGGLGYVGSCGSCWSASPYNYNAYYLYFYYNGSVNPSSNFNRAYGFSVRCLQEE